MSAIGRFVTALVMGLVAGVPVIGGIAIESAMIAWMVDAVRGGDGFGTVFAWVFLIQAGVVCLFAVPAVVVKAIDTAVHGWE